MKLIPSQKMAAGDPLRPSWTYDLSRLILLTWFRLFHFARFRGQNQIPRKGPLIFCPNHVSYYDPPLVGVGVPFGMTYMAWDALFRVPILSAFIRSVGAFPVKLKTADKAAIETTLQVLRGNGAVTIFPEGGRSFTGELYPFEVGAFRMALQTGATVVPVSILGIFEAWSPHNPTPTLWRPLDVKYHAPITVPTDVPRSEMKAAVESLREQVRRVIHRRQRAWERLKAMKARQGVWA